MTHDHPCTSKRERMKRGKTGETAAADAPSPRMTHDHGLTDRLTDGLIK